MTMFAMFAVLAMLCGAIVAAWPLLLLPQFRRPMLGGLGSSFLTAGAALFGLTIGGLLPLTGFASRALAEDPPANSSGDSAPASGSGAAALPPAEAAPAAPSPAADPALETHEDSPIVPPGRPAWIEKEPGQSGDVYSVAVASGPYAHEREAQRALDRELEKTTREYIADYLGSALAPRFLAYDARAITERLKLVKSRYHDVATYSVGPMYEYFALVEFDKGFRDELDSRWANVRGTSRLAQMGLFAGAGLLLLTSVFGYFRLDNATRGYYTGRLQFMTAAAILAVVGAGALVAQWITWL